MNKDILKLLKDRYFLDGEASWDELALRVSKFYPSIYADIKNMSFIPSTPTLMHSNTEGERAGTLSSCFPMDIEDSIEGIFDAIKESAITTKLGGGVGYDYSGLRSSKEKVKSNNRNSSGPLPFIKIVDTMLDGIQQGGVRRGAGMALLSIEHPDIIDFIEAKKNKKEFNRNNFSIRITNKFYDSLLKSPNSIHRVKLKDNSYIDLEYKGKKISTIDLWDKIMYYAWDNAEPGIFNYDIAWDRCSVKNVDSHILANPCQEFVNIPYSSCNLGSINVSNLVINKSFDWEYFSILISKSVNFLNEVIDNNVFPIEKIKETTLKIRPIGLGIMGLAHCLFKLELPYNSEEAYEFTEKIFQYLTLKSMEVSCDLAKENKKSYPSFDKKIFIEANKRFFSKNIKIFNVNSKQILKNIKKYGVYNSCFTSIAPTGSISTIAETSSGIEPVFALTYKRKIEKLNKEYDEIFITDKIFEKYLDVNHSDFKLKILEEVSSNKGSCQKSKHLSDKEKLIFKTASDITSSDHVYILSAVANNISLSVSKTINLSNDATLDDVKNIYIEAYNKGIIGVTIYRDGCRDGILTTEDNKKENLSIERREAPKRPKELSCDIHSIDINNEKFTILVGKLNGTLYELFVDNNHVDIQKYKKGFIKKISKNKYNLMVDGKIIIENISKEFNKTYGTLTRLISMSLRHSTPLEFVVSQLSKGDAFVSFEKAVGRVLKKYIKNGEKVKSSVECSNCGSTAMIYIEGCRQCISCGMSACS